MRRAHRSHSFGTVRITPIAGEVRSSVRRHPAQDGRSGEVLGLAADLPDALVGIAAVLDGGLHQSTKPVPDAVDDLGGALA
jgi:hypothetical protein